MTVAKKLKMNKKNSPQTSISYIGRFAPTPSGPLHFGSLIAALGSFLDAKAHHGKWLLRIEDIDKERTQLQAIDTIYRQLEALHLYWDDAVRIQSEHLDDYHQALTTLLPELYPCSCSRRQWHPYAHKGALGPIYPQFCRQNTLINIDTKDIAIRMLVMGTNAQGKAEISGHKLTVIFDPNPMNFTNKPVDPMELKFEKTNKEAAEVVLGNPVAKYLQEKYSGIWTFYDNGTFSAEGFAQPHGQYKGTYKGNWRQDGTIDITTSQKSKAVISENGNRLEWTFEHPPLPGENDPFEMTLKFLTPLATAKNALAEVKNNASDAEFLEKYAAFIAEVDRALAYKLDDTHKIEIENIQKNQEVQNRYNKFKTDHFVATYKGKVGKKTRYWTFYNNNVLSLDDQERIPIRAGTYTGSVAADGTITLKIGKNTMTYTLKNNAQTLTTEEGGTTYTFEKQ